MEKADAAMQEYYREQAYQNEEGCEICGGVYSCKHHYFPKKKSATLRYDEDNLISICAGCHLGHHMGDPRVHHKLEKKRGDKWFKDLEKKKAKTIQTSMGYYRDMIKKYESNL